VDLDRQSIERRDFPIGRRGYEPAAVDAHLRTLAADVEELEQSLLSARGHETLGSAAASQVQSILEAAEVTAADIERQAAEEAAETRRRADEDARRTRSDAVARAKQHVAAVSQATATLLEKVESMDQEVSALVQSLRAGAGRLASDLRAVETNMGELYDAASGSSGAVTGDVPAPDGAGESAAPAGAVEPQSAVPVGPTAPVVPPAPVARSAGPQSPAGPLSPAHVATSTSPAVQAAQQASNGSSEPAARMSAASSPVGASSVPPSASGKSSGGEADLDGARLIALNMALNGEPRAQADRYLAENFDLPDRDKLLDEVYAAIEG
jgi:hypothetical protein